MVFKMAFFSFSKKEKVMWFINSFKTDNKTLAAEYW